MQLLVGEVDPDRFSPSATEREGPSGRTASYLKDGKTSDRTEVASPFFGNPPEPPRPASWTAQHGSEAPVVRGTGPVPLGPIASDVPGSGARPSVR